MIQQSKKMTIYSLFWLCKMEDKGNDDGATQLRDATRPSPKRGR